MAHTIRDVAAKAGVSVATVSHVLNKTRYTAPQTMQKVLDAVKDLNFHTNAHARRLAMRKSDLFGLIISEIANPFFSELINGFQSAAWENGYDTLLYNTEHDPRRMKLAVRKMIETDVRGVAVMSSAIEREATAELKEHDIGSVFYNTAPPEVLVSNITLDYDSGITQAVDHLRKLGHRTIAIISGPKSNRTAVALEKSMVNCLRHGSIEVVATLESDYRVDGGIAAVSQLLAQPDRPTAIVCGNDLIAMGAMSALEERSVRVPEEISVIGVDDIFFAKLTRPPLTTIKIPREELGRLSFLALERIAKSKRHQGSEYTLRSELVVRRSTARPPAQKITAL